MTTAMIWGAGGGIGLALTKLLVGEGWTVAAIARQTAALEPLTPHVFAADVGDERAVAQTVRLLAQEVAGVDLWVYAAGDILAVPVVQMRLADWQRILTANLTGAYLTVQHSLPLLAEKAHLVFLGAVSERLRLPGLSAYATAKAGLEAFADTLRKEQPRLRVTVVRPGAVATALWDKVPLKLPADAATPEQIAGRILQAHRDGHKGVLDIVH